MIKKIIPIFVGFSIVVMAAIVLIITNNPKRLLQKRFGWKLSDEYVISRHATYIDGLSLCHAYDIVFDEDDLDNTIELAEGLLQSDHSLDIKNAKELAESINGVPYKKKWLNTEKENLIWWYSVPDGTRITITGEDSGRCHIYIEW